MIPVYAIIFTDILKTLGLNVMSSRIIENIKKRGYARIYFPTGNLAEKAMVGFNDFLTESLEYRRLWTFDLDEETETGYLTRDKPINKMTGYAYDHKDVFHLCSDLLGKLRTRNIKLRNHQNWLLSLHQLYSTILGVAMKIVGDLAAAYPDLSISSRVATRRNSHVLRVLHYHMKKREGGLIGAGHKDESLLTIHVADNFPGLKVGMVGSTELVTSGRNISLVYPGKELEQLTQGDLPALYHEIVDTRPEISSFDYSKDKHEAGLNRMAIVFFLDANV